MIPNTTETRNLIPKLASICNIGVSSFTSNVPFIDTRSRISDINDGLPFLSTAPTVWTLNSVDSVVLENLYERYLAYENDKEM